jgi:hypothetical protein
MSRACVYTALYGPFDRLPEQPVRAASGLDFIAFVGDPALRSDTWQVRPLSPELPSDPVRSARYAKLMPHILLPDYDVSIYIDCSVELLAPPEAMQAALLDGRPEGFACLRHDHRDSIAAEARAVIELGLDGLSVVRDQLAAYLAAGYAEQVPLIWSGILLRRHLRADVVRAMELWWHHVLRYSRRDQLSFPFVAHAESLAVAAHDYGARVSPWHRWPVPETRLRAPVHPPLPPPDGSAGGAALRAVVSWLEDRITAPLRAAEAGRDGAQTERDAALSRARTAEAQAAAARADLALMRSSTIWRAAAPARWLMDALRGGRRPG